MGEETIELVMTDGTSQFVKLSKALVNRLNCTDLITHGTFAVEG